MNGSGLERLNSSAEVPLTSANSPAARASIVQGMPMKKIPVDGLPIRSSKWTCSPVLFVESFESHLSATSQTVAVQLGFG
jgi:hypothetical protein